MSFTKPRATIKSFFWNGFWITYLINLDIVGRWYLCASISETKKSIPLSDSVQILLVRNKFPEEIQVCQISVYFAPI